MLSALEAAPAPDYPATLNNESRPLRERLAAFGRSAAEHSGDTGGTGDVPGVFAALLRAPDALQRYRADVSAGLATGCHPVRSGCSGR